MTPGANQPTKWPLVLMEIENKFSKPVDKENTFTDKYL